MGLVKRAIGAPFETATRIRSWAYSHGLLSVASIDVPVISVGNINVGGSGKTPLVLHLVRELRAQGRNPGVLSRGYGRRRGEKLNDEGRLLENRFPGLPQVQNPDRVAGAGLLLQEDEVDCLVLDDGFQHRRMGRDLDLVCLDISRPWFWDHLLPAGRLREPSQALLRAHVLIFTRTDQVREERLELCLKMARIHSQGRPVLLARHAPRDLLRVGPEGEEKFPLDHLAGQEVFTFCGIASPRSFERTLADVGAKVLGRKAILDHRSWRDKDLAAIAREAKKVGAKYLVTTEKDYARRGSFPFPVHVVRIDFVLTRGEEVLQTSLAQLFQRGDS